MKIRQLVVRCIRIRQGGHCPENQGNQGKSRKVKKSKNSEGKVRGSKQFSESRSLTIP